MFRLIPLAALLVALSASAQVTWSDSHPIFPVLDDGTSVANGDLDGDGDQDVVMTRSSGELVFFENNGTGQFSGNQCDSEALLGQLPKASLTHVDDLNGDGHMDVLVVVASYWQLYALFNNGDGSMTEPLLISSEAAFTEEIVTADFNGDGHQDILLTQPYNGAISWMENDGTGANWNTHLLVSELDDPQGIAAADLNSDGAMDILYTEAGAGTVSWMAGEGAGTFGDPVAVFSNLDNTTSVATGDLNNDGHLDVISASPTQKLLVWMAGDGAGSFGAQQLIFDNANGAARIQTGDFDNDGWLDVICLNTAASKIIYYPNEGGFFEDDYQIIIDYMIDSVDLAVFDSDGDDVPDISAITPLVVATCRNAGNGVVWYPTWHSYLMVEPEAALAEDFDGDGHTDLMVTGEASGNGNAVAICYGNGTGCLNFPITLEDQIPEIRDVIMADMDADGLEDIVLMTEDDVRYLKRTGSTTYLDSQVAIAMTGGLYIDTGDFNGDGAADAIVDLHNSHDYQVLHNDGSGALSLGETWSYSSAGFANLVKLGDMNGDGHLDVVSYDNGSRAAWRQGDGAGGFATHVDIAAYNSVTQVGIADMDDDGDLDVVFITSGSSSWAEDRYYVATNNGDMSELVVVERLETATNIWKTLGFALYDVDNNGYKDVVTSYHYQQDWDSFYGYGKSTLNNGPDTDWVLNSPSAAFSKIDTQNLEVADFDGDGYATVIAPNRFGEVVMATEVSLNQGCTNPLACANYDPAAQEDDGSCCLVCDCSDLNAINFNPIADCDDGSCEYTSGCTHPSAINYDPEAYLDDGSCEFIEGCTYSSAINYNPDAYINDGSCLGLCTGVVWDDLDEDGYKDANEYGVAFQTVVVNPGSLVLTTNDLGEYQVELPWGGHYLEVIDNPNLPFNTTSNPRYVNVNGTEIANFGLSKEAPVYEVCVDFYPSGNGFLCNDWSNHNICFRNMGNVPVSGVVSVDIDPMFQGWQEVTPIDSTDGNTVYMSYQDLQPGQMFMYDILLNTPTVDWIGEYAVSTVHIVGFDDTGTAVAFGEQDLVTEIACAYDPNDKQAFPLGYGDDHRLLVGTEQEYLVRFQNTGNAPAQNIVIRDTLDVNFDIESFQIVANSHSMMAQLNTETREVQFQFWDIQLPDSTCCEPDSHGLVSYKIRSLPGLEAETRLENTAYIYFDNNDPIVTNTTWTTIHECGQTFDMLPTVVDNCPIKLPGIETNFNDYNGLGGDFYWTGDDGIESTSPSVTLPVGYSGGIQLTVDNPLCTEMTSTDNWQASTNLEWLTCTGDVNCDGNIGVTDLIDLLGLYGCIDTCTYEVTGDGSVNADDVLLVLSYVGTSCP